MTVDMNGFTISCSVSCATTGVGSSGNGTILMNGTVTGYAPVRGSGINFTGAAGTVDHMNVIANNVGISAGPDLSVTTSKVTNGAYGPGVRMTILNSVISGHLQDGVDILDGLVS